jgi:hypothetical protein
MSLASSLNPQTKVFARNLNLLWLELPEYYCPICPKQMHDSEKLFRYGSTESLKLLLNNDSGSVGGWQSHPWWLRKPLFLRSFLLRKYFAKGPLGWQSGEY